MNEEEKEAIKEVKSYIEWVKDRGTNTDKDIEIILNLIDKLQKEIDKKDKVIDLMAEDRTEISEPRVSKEAIIDFYFKKVGEEE